MSEENTVEEIGASPREPQVPEHIPRIHTPHENLSPRAARLMDLAAYEMASIEGPEPGKLKGFIDSV